MGQFDKDALAKFVESIGGACNEFLTPASTNATPAPEPEPEPEGLTVGLHSTRIDDYFIELIVQLSGVEMLTSGLKAFEFRVIVPDNVAVYAASKWDDSLPIKAEWFGTQTRHISFSYKDMWVSGISSSDKTIKESGTLATLRYLVPRGTPAFEIKLTHVVLSARGYESNGVMHRVPLAEDEPSITIV